MNKKFSTYFYGPNQDILRRTFTFKISDITPLKGLTNLKELELWDNPISEDQKAMLKKALPDCDIRF